MWHYIYLIMGRNKNRWAKPSKKLDRNRLIDDAKATEPENFAFMQKINSHPVHLFSLL